MKILPTENITYKTKIQKDEIINRLKDITGRKRYYRYTIVDDSSRKIYEGVIRAHDFNIKRIAPFRNPSIPQIHGTVQHDLEGTIIKVTIRLQWRATLSLFVMCLALGASSVFYFVQGALGMQTVFLTLIFFYAFLRISFKIESKNSKEDFKELFEADIIEY
jgi:hypothetical protein